jgi:hypothetical protein
MRHVQLRSFGPFLVALISIMITGAGDKERQPFLNLARVDIHVQGQQQAAELITLVQAFASERGYKITGAAFPKRGRMVTNLTILIKAEPETHWGLINFRDPNTFELLAYSHDEESVWRGPWDELVSKISASLGEANIVKKK